MRRLVLAAVAVVLIASPATLADPADTGLFLGASIGVAFVQQDSFIPNVEELDENDFSWKLSVGYRAANFFAVEGNYRDFGSVSTTSGMLETNSETQAFDIDGLGILKIGVFDVFGKLGVAFWDTTGNAGPLDLDADGTSLVWGLGFQFRMRSLGIRLEYEVIDTTRPDELSMLSAGVTWTF